MPAVNRPLSKEEIPVSVLVDLRNWETMKPHLIAKFAVKDQLNGVDLETHDADRHEGLNRQMRSDEDGVKSSTAKLLFDMERTVITGFSLYVNDDNVAFYFNAAHADVENRIPLPELLDFLTQVRDSECWFLAHKAPFELAMTMKSWKWFLGPRVICTLQLAVSCFNDDTYPMERFNAPGFGDAFEGMAGRIAMAYRGYRQGDEMTNEQEELLFKFIAKTSDSAHSYNGYVKSIKYGYGLKALSEYFFGYKQVDYATVLSNHGANHMGQLTGEQVCSYGADDAWTCTKLYSRLMQFLLETNPGMVQTFFEQENPMIYQYARVWRTGIVINHDAVIYQRGEQRRIVAEYLRYMKYLIRELLPFPEELHEKLVKYDPKAYGKATSKNGWDYRKAVIDWAESPDCEDDYEQIMQVRTSISKQWSQENGDKESNGPSITYYQVVRCLFYDLCQCSFQLVNSKIQGDEEAQINMRNRLFKKHGVTAYPEKQEEFDTAITKVADPHAVFTLKLLWLYRQLAAAEQVIKLYINKYMNLIDPETSRMYPVLSSTLNSHRMGLEEPNVSALPKFKGTSWVRSFFEPDSPDHVIVSIDWSAVELVLIGDQSQDPTFAKAFGQIPHDDLHSETVAALLEISLETLKGMENRKELRTKYGKPANFGYWYSGALGTVAKELGWTSEQMWDYVEKYRAKYPVAEQWRLAVIAEAQSSGYVMLPDGHKRYRYESTGQWVEMMRMKFAQFGPEVSAFGEIAIKKIRNRSGNQAVNSMIQGTCATLAKRSIIEIDKSLILPYTEVRNPGGFDARFMFPVHDELAYSCHRKHAVQFSYFMKEKMCNHPDIVKYLKLDASAAMGRNYLAWDLKKNPKGQIELDEASKGLPCIPEARWGKSLTRDERELVLTYLMEQ